MSLAPLVADGKVLVGASGGELGIRGFVAAFDVDDGKRIWKNLHGSAPGEPGSETWPKGDQWKTGGGPVWVTGNYDPATNLTFWGTGNGGPWMGDQRPATISTPRRRSRSMPPRPDEGHFQYHPNDSWDWDEVSPPILVDYTRRQDGQGLIDVARDGYLWFLERTDGRINFVEGMPYVKQNVFRASIRRPAGPTSIRRAARARQAKRFLSVALGRQELAADRVQPEDPHDLHSRPTRTSADDHRPADHIHAGGLHGRTTRRADRAGADHIGEVQAWNVDTATRVWTHTFPASANWGPMLATGGGLVFSGGTSDRMFRAFDASTGAVLWEFPTNSGVIGQPSSFMVDGRQYVAVQSGWGIDARAMQSRLNRLSPGKFPEVPEGGAVWVFAIN
jgi:alcohol dehydrogenase (cytochrome c)